MPFCSSGATEQIPGTTDDVYLTAAFLGVLAAKFAPWLEPFIGYGAAEMSLHLPTFCAVDPPADPGLTGPELLSLVALGPGPLTQGATDKLKQLLRRWAWPSFCRCAAVTTPAVPPIPTAPTGTPAINPPQIDNSAPCYELRHPGYTVNSIGSGNNITSAFWSPSIQFVNSTLQPVFNATPGQAWSTIRLSVTNTATAPFGWNVTINTWQWPGGSSTHFNQQNTVLAPGATITQTFHYDSSNPYLQSGFTVNSGSGVSQIIYSMDMWCSGGPGANISPCCPPDLTANSLLTQILAQVNLIQRQAAPFGYLPGATHAGLTGSGHLTVADLLGCKLTITTFPPGVIGTVAGDPLTLFEAGWINWGSADGFRAREFIGASPLLSFPADAGAMTKIGYSLNAGVVATIDELVREP